MSKKYKQILKEIEVRIIAKDYSPNEPMPSEFDLAFEFNCGVLTIRKVLGILAERGMLIRIQGKGTFPIVRNNHADREIISLNQPYHIHREISNEKLNIKVVKFSIILADECIANKLNVQANEAVYEIVRLHCVDGHPQMIETNFIAVRYIPSFSPEEFGQSMIETIEGRLKKQVKHTATYFRAELATENDGEMLRLGESSAVLVSEVLYYLQNGVVVNFAIHRYNPDCYEFFVYA
ncbi:MAG: GntR family transcriptional regulator [Bacilli bacterium]